MVERSLSMREAPGSIPGLSILVSDCTKMFILNQSSLSVFLPRIFLPVEGRARTLV